MKLVLAPMATLSHEALRLLVHRYGDPDEYFSEMIHAPSFIGEGRFEHWYIRNAPCPDRMVWQLTGSTPEPMARAAVMLRRQGGIGVDLNMGCSAPDIARCGAGIAWMLKPAAETATLVSMVRSALDRESVGDGSAGVPFRLSVKMRLGEEENYPGLLEFCRMLVDEGVEMITLHPRIRKDKYSRPARREWVGRLASDLSIPVYGNGDVFSAEDASSFFASNRCAGLMIGRGAVMHPWIFADIRGLARDRIDHLEVSRFFLETLATSQPPEFQISRAHRFFFYYCENFSFAHHIKMRIQNAQTPEAIGGLLEEYFDQVPADRLLEPRR